MNLLPYWKMSNPTNVYDFNTSYPADFDTGVFQYFWVTIFDLIINYDVLCIILRKTYYCLTIVN